jgi:ATP synthase F1 complex assembly factor 1
MYTPLGEYKLRQTFAQPTLILTHYTDLAESHGIVLMRGDITPNSNGSPKITAIEAQMLVLRLAIYALFYAEVFGSHYVCLP